MPDEEEVYLTMMRAFEKVRQDLGEGQWLCEELFFRDEGATPSILNKPDTAEDTTKAGSEATCE